MFGLGTQELLIILFIAFFIFGGKKLPEIGAGLGKGLKAFKQGLKDMDSDVSKETDDHEKKAVTSSQENQSHSSAHVEEKAS